MNIFSIICIILAFAAVVLYILFFYGLLKFKKSDKPEQVNLQDLELLLYVSKNTMMIDDNKDGETLVMLLESVHDSGNSLNSFKIFLDSMKRIDFRSNKAKQIQEKVNAYDFDESHSKLRKSIKLIGKILSGLWDLFLFVFLVFEVLQPTTMETIKIILLILTSMIIGSNNGIVKRIEQLQKYLTVLN